MKHVISNTLFFVWGIMGCSLFAQKSGNGTTSSLNTLPPGKHLFIDVHHLEPGKLTTEAVAGAHAKDLAVEGKYGVQFIKYWVDTAKGVVYCLSSASDSSAIIKTHAEAHGLLPDHIYPVTDGNEALRNGGKNLYLDVHELGAGNVTASDVAGAHQKDLAVEKKYGVNFINYWVDEKDGVVMCLSEASDSSDIIKTHKEAHGLLPKYILEVKQGQ
ncbi:MAG TPA: DUF4242 domain-containing protein [Chitinophagaceae bacterium]|nr:DUF4242 domain-containing protein [Chitinophagaceae bacterium]